MKPKRIIIIPYNVGSASAKSLKHELQKATGIRTLIVRKDSTKYQPRWSDYIINWGCSKEWEYITRNVKYGHVNATDKLKTFYAIQEWNNMQPDDYVNTPEWTDDKNVAKAWEGLVVCRKILNGHSAAGIILHDNATDGELPTVPLYVKYKKKQNEYRVHVFKGEVIDVTQKKKRKDAEFVDTKIRNHKNGWVYAREDLFIPPDLYEQAQRTLDAVELQFGAVDIIWNKLENKSYVLEVNTAPGLTGTTLTKYVEAFIKDMGI